MLTFAALSVVVIAITEGRPGLGITGMILTVIGIWVGVVARMWHLIGTGLLDLDVNIHPDWALTLGTVAMTMVAVGMALFYFFWL